MKADLILVSHNSKADLERFLPSIKANTKDYNLLIVDNGSNEETKEFLKNSGEKVIFQDNKGYGAACNTGAKATSSEFIVFLNCDLLASKDWLIDLLRPFGDPIVAITGARLFNEQDNEYPTPRKNFVVGCCLAIRREIFEKLGGFDENFFLFFEETDLCRRAVHAGFQVVRSEATLTHFHPHFPPFSPELQAHWDKSEAYFKEKDKNFVKNSSLALVMIVKNEELGLERAILSVKDFCDEIVIAVDNESSDKTLEIAQKYATTLKRFDFHDDFSEARNFAHEGVKSDWIIFLDGHEFVAAAPDLKKHLSSNSEGLMCPIEMETGMIFANPRIYRNGVQFVGRIHERQGCRSTEPYPGFLIKHDRACGQSAEASAAREKQRDEQITRIIGGELKENKKNTRASFHLALHAQTKRDYKAAIGFWKLCLKYEKDLGERWYCFFNISVCHFSLGHPFRAFWYASKADNETPGRWEISKLKGMIYFYKNRLSAAPAYLIESFKDNSCVVSYLPWPRDDSGTWNMLGECFYRLGYLDKASSAFDRAAELAKDEKFKIFLGKRAHLMSEIFKSQYNKKVE